MSLTAILGQPAFLSVYCGIVVVLSSSIATGSQIPTPSSQECDRGVELYKQKDFEGAVRTLEKVLKSQKNDITAWHYLGLSLEQSGKNEDARKAHERAARIAENFLDQMVAPSKSQLLDAIDSTEQYIKLSDLSAKKLQEWRDRLSYLKLPIQNPADFEVYKGTEVTTKPKVLSKPDPAYTPQALDNRVSGTVVLRALFAADGHVRAIRPVLGLPDGLTERAILAAQQIKFIPATKDGKPVSMWMELQYNFSLR
jgi:tetratricopeptide (TPR) repeat protein